MSDAEFDRRVTDRAAALRQEMDEKAVEMAAQLRVIAERHLRLDPNSTVAAQMLAIGQGKPGAVARYDDESESGASSGALGSGLLPLVNEAGDPVINEQGHTLYIPEAVAKKYNATAVVNPKTKEQVGWTRSFDDVAPASAPVSASAPKAIEPSGPTARPAAQLLEVYEADGETRDGSATLQEGLRKKYTPVFDPENQNLIIAFLKPPPEKPKKRRGLWGR